MISKTGWQQQKSALKLEREIEKLDELSQQGIQFFYLDGRKIHNKEDFLREAAAAMQFPDYFGANWDAFDECITDLAWRPAQKYVLVYDRPDIFAKADPEQWQMAEEILRSAVEYWQTAGTPMEVWALSLLT